MKKSKTTLFTILLMLALTFIGCTQPDVEAELKAIQPNESKDPVVAVINLPGAGSKTRTILPGELELAHHYTITLTNEKLAEPIVLQNVMANEQNKLEIKNVPVNSYTVHVDGHNQAGQIMLKGDGDKTLEISPNKVAEVTVKVTPQYGPELKGSIAVTFDWTAVVKNLNPSTPSDSQSVETVGPLTQAISENYLEFELYTGKIGGPLTKTGETVVWNDPDTTSKTCLFNNVPTGKNIYVALTIKDKNHNVIVDKQYGITAQVFADQTSYYNGDSTYNIYLNDSMDQWYRNISNVTVTYPEQDFETSFIVNWNDERNRRTGESFYSEVRISYGKYNVPEGQQDEKALPAFTPTNHKEDNHITISNLESNTEYYIKSQAVSRGGKLTDTIIWTLAPNKGFKTKVNLGGLTFDPKYSIPESLVSGQNFEVKANITNANATYPTLVYKVVDLSQTPGFTDDKEPIFYINNPSENNAPANVTANRPGVAKIEVTNNDQADPNHSQITDSVIKVTLSTPQNLTQEVIEDALSGTRGVKLTWTAVEHAEEYVIYRSDNKAEYQVLGEPTSANEFTDQNIETGHSYKYKVVAKAPSIDAEYISHNFKADSAASNETTEVLIPVPSIQIVPVSIKEAVFELSEVTADGDRNHIYTDLNEHTNNIDLFISLKANEQKTVGLAEPVEGFDTYTWLIDNEIIRSGSFAEAGTIVLSDAIVYDPMIDTHTVTFTLSNTGNDTNYSANIILKLVTKPVASVQASVLLNDVETSVIRYSTAEKQTLRIKGTALTADGTTPSVQNVEYRLVNSEGAPVSGGQPAVDINQHTGVITIAEYGKYTFEVYSSEDSRIKDTVVFTFYEPSVQSPENLVQEVNKVFSTALKAANTKLSGDWWHLSSDNWTNEKPNWTISAWINTSGGYNQGRNGSIIFNNHKTTLGTIGDVTMTNYKSSPEADYGTFGIQAGASGTTLGGYTGTNPLHLIGTSGDSENIHDNVLIIELPYFQGKAYIRYKNIDVLSTSASGSYEVYFTENIVTANHTYIASEINTLNAVDVGRPTVK